MFYLYVFFFSNICITYVTNKLFQSKDDDYNYYPKVHIRSKANNNVKRKSVIHQWISATLNTMAEISEQVVSARGDL